MLADEESVSGWVGPDARRRHSRHAALHAAGSLWTQDRCTGSRYQVLFLADAPVRRAVNGYAHALKSVLGLASETASENIRALAVTLLTW